jgi:ABC-type phosphate transport system ATPase subunit
MSAQVLSFNAPSGTMEQKATYAALAVRNLSVFFGANEVLKGVSLDISPRAVTACMS